MGHLDAHLRFLCDRDPDQVVALLARSIPTDVLRQALRLASGEAASEPPSGHASPLPRLDSR